MHVKAGAKAAIAALGVTAGLAGFTGSAAAAPVEHDGPFLSKESNGAKSFRIRDDESGRVFRYRVNNQTRFERIPGGFSGLERGMVISADGRRNANGRIIATEVETDR
jgi:Domain of unknown function (DUF5666)